MQEDTAQEKCAQAGAISIEAHNERAGFVIDDEEHGLIMLMVDLLGYAEKHGIDMDKALESARETYDDVIA